MLSSSSPVRRPPATEEGEESDSAPYTPGGDGGPYEYIPQLFRNENGDNEDHNEDPDEPLSYYHESPHRASKQFGRVIYEDPRVDSEGTVKARLQSDETLPREAVVLMNDEEITGGKGI